MLEELIAAIKANTAAVERSIALRTEAIQVAQNIGATEAAPAPEAAPKTSRKKAEAAAPAPEPEAASEVQPAPEAEAAPEPVKEANPYEGLGELIAEYFAVERPEERKARQEKVKALLNHPKVAKSDLTDEQKAKPNLENIAVGSIPLFKDQMALLKKKGDLTTPEEDSLV